MKESKDESWVNLAAGADYEFKLSDNWRWKNDAMLYTNIYDKKVIVIYSWLAQLGHVIFAKMLFYD